MGKDDRRPRKEDTRTKRENRKRASGAFPSGLSIAGAGKESVKGQRQKPRSKTKGSERRVKGNGKGVTADGAAGGRRGARRKLALAFCWCRCRAGLKRLLLIGLLQVLERALLRAPGQGLEAVAAVRPGPGAVQSDVAEAGAGAIPAAVAARLGRGLDMRLVQGLLPRSWSGFCPDAVATDVAGAGARTVLGLGLSQ